MKRVGSMIVCSYFLQKISSLLDAWQVCMYARYDGFDPIVVGSGRAQ